MPKQMFFNIDEKKRQMFLDVAIEEFTTKTFTDVSVNSIIKKANISRGSFYTYFENLDELFNYIIQTVKNERINYAKVLIEEADGDLFVAIKSLFKYDFDAFKDKGRYSLFRNYIYYIQLTKHASLKDTIIMEAIMQATNNGEKLSKNLQLENMKLSKDEFIDLVEVAILLMVNTFLKAENEGLSKEETLSLFNRRISYFENGLKHKKIDCD